MSTATPKYKYGQRVIISKSKHPFYDGAEVTIVGVEDNYYVDNQPQYSYEVIFPLLGKDDIKRFDESALHPVPAVPSNTLDLYAGVRAKFKEEEGDWVTETFVPTPDCYKVFEDFNGNYQPFYGLNMYNPDDWELATKEEIADQKRRDGGE